MLASTFSSSDYIYPSILPWQEIFDDLRKAGCPPYRVSLLVGYGWSTVQRWVYDGVEPRYSVATAILELHTRYCGEEATQQRSREGRQVG